MYRKIAALLLCAVLLFAGCTPAASTDVPTPQPPPSPDTSLPPLRCTVFAIGKADASLLYGDGFAILIDTGETEDAEEILTYLTVKRITRLDALIITHFDKDHVGGAADILDRIKVDAVYTTYRVKTSDEITAYDAAMHRAGLTETVVRETTGLHFGNDLTLTVLPPQSESYPRKESNNSSLVIRATYGEKALLFAADAQEERLSELLDGVDITADFLKVPYHGNNLDNLPPFLAAVKPKFAAVTCSDKNPEEAEKMAALRASGAEVFLTRGGNVYVYCDGHELTTARREKA